MPLPIPAEASQSPAANWDGRLSVVPEMPPTHCLFKCSECQIAKSSCEDLEVHIKVEHLNWLPFSCTICGTLRASDNQIREHTYSHHKLTDHNKYVYYDNPQAKSQLQKMTDRALSLAIQQMVARHPPPMASNNILYANGVSASNSNGTPLNHKAAKRQRLHQIIGRNISYDQENTEEVLASSSNNEENLISDLKAIIDLPIDNSEVLNNDQLVKLLDQIKNVSAEIDPEDSTVSSEILKSLKGTDVEGKDEEGIDTGEMLKNISSLFSVDINNLCKTIEEEKRPATPLSKKFNPKGRRRTANSAASQCASKKRVLGICARCGKPVTAGARQMHLFFHLSKDHGVYRFRCQFPNCTIEHYRKDQMENHMSKVHGRVDHEQMEDRSTDLHGQIKQLSMKLLGTTGNKPGPTAARAQEQYNQMLNEQQLRRRKRAGNLARAEPAEDGPVSMVENKSLEALQQIYNSEMFTAVALPEAAPSTALETVPEAASEMIAETSSQTALELLPETAAEVTIRNSGKTYVKVGERLEELLDCKLCKKPIISRTRGLHILHHARNDLGLIRYECAFCDFKHERSQSVINHAKKAHGKTYECLTDTLNKYENEIKSLWKACFGHERVFMSESKKKSKALKAAMMREEELLKDSLAIEESYQSFQSDAPSGLRIFNSSNEGLSPSKYSQSNGASSSKVATSSAKKKISSRRFGIRKPQSKQRRAEMAKLREVSMRIGGAMYFKKRSPEAVYCEQCNKYVSNRLTNHAYSHLKVDLFLCPTCKMGSSNRNHVMKHIKDFHKSSVNPIDNRSKFAADIKEQVRLCFPSIFVDAPVPTPEEIEKLKKTLNLTNSQLFIEGDSLIENEDLENESNDTEAEEPIDDELNQDTPEEESEENAFEDLNEIKDVEMTDT